MRILAIRGKNLAALAGEFVVDFQAPPLAQTGLFAICGPTGAGKSTLLDALCLALYDATPRLKSVEARKQEPQLPDSADHSVSQQDPRNLLRRGAVHGFAEVDFVGNDGMAYRARWSVRRARNKAQGKLQDAELTLHTKDGQRIGAGKTEVKEALCQRIGLSFEQFTRAVVLAQNEFAAFLKADQNQRSALLETLTGADIYRRISQRAYLQRRNAESQLQQLQQQFSALAPLSVELRQQWQQALHQAQEQISALEQRKTQLEQQWQWQQRQQELAQAAQHAEQLWQQAQAQQQGSAERHKYLVLVEAVAEARPYVDALQRTSADYAAAQRNLSAAQAAQQPAQQRLQQAATARAQAVSALAAAEQQRHAAAAGLQQARELDASLQTLHPQQEVALHQVQTAQTALTTAQQAHTAKQEERQRCVAHLQSAEAWLNQHSALQPLAQNWPRWDEVLKQAASLHSQVQDAAQRVQISSAECSAQQQALAQATQRQQQAANALHAAQAAVQAAPPAAAAAAAEALAQRRQQVQQEQQQLLDAQRLWEALQTDTLRQQELERSYGEAQSLLSTFADSLRELRNAIPSAAGRLQQAEQAWHTARLACAGDVLQLRAQLTADAPCPVCGSTAHPYRSAAAPSAQLLATLQAQMQSCRQALDNLRLQETDVSTRHSMAQQGLSALAAERAALQPQLAKSAAAWAAHPCTLTTIAAAERSAWFHAGLQALQSELRDIEQAEQVQRQAAQAREQAQQQYVVAQQQQLQTQSAYSTAHAASEQAQQALAAAQQQESAVRQQLEQRLTELDALFPGHAWRPLWAADAAHFHAARRSKVQAWQQQRQLQEQCQQQLRTLEIELAYLSTGLAERHTQLHGAQQQLQTLQQVVQQQQQQRATLWEGRSVAAVEAAFAQDIERAQRQVAATEQMSQQAQQAHTSAATTLDQAQQLCSAAANAEQAAQNALQAWLATCNARLDSKLDAAALSQLLSHDRAWIAEERRALQTLADAVQTTASVYRERQAQCQAHEQQRLLLVAAETLPAARQALQEQLATWQQRQSEAQFHLRQDEERCAQAKDLQQRIVEQEAVHALWHEMDDAIGSASGDKFSKYAQQFTLDALLAYANRHLADIAPRYRLQRSAGSLALFVIDQDLGDEVRSVHSLSGGESFLVSLALALALASLSAQRVRVESLFIDEGFGSLDVQTLRMALDALDNLQAQGRKVGVISHVAEMAERIGVRIEVQPQSAGQSLVRVQGV